MFDLIDESGKDLKNYGYRVKRLDKFGFSQASLSIDTDGKSKALSMDKGDYFILNAPRLYDYGMEASIFIIDKLAKALKNFFKKLAINKCEKVLIVGLGNPDILSDKLGKVVFDNIEINPLKKKNNVFKFCPNIYFSTGIETIDMVGMFVKGMEIDYVILIDSLTTSNIERLGTSFQITTTGMTPGSGVNRFGRRINNKSIGAKCISIGVPFMIFASQLNSQATNDILLAPKDIGENVERAGFIIASAIMEVLR